MTLPVTAPSADSGAEVAQGLRRRDLAVVERLVEQYGQRLRRYLLHLTGDAALADDLFQETWLRVMERGPRYDGRSPFVAWLLTVARHLAVDQWRRRRPGGFDPREAAAPAERPSPFDEVAARETHERLEGMMARLPAIHREVLLLRFHEGLSLAEIARIVGVAVPTVKSRLYRALDGVGSFWGGQS